MKKYNVLISALAAVCGLCVTGTTPAHSQYTNPYTGRTWNNPMSSFLDTVILNNSRAMMLRNSLNSMNTMNSSLAATRARMLKAGNLKIKSGTATMRFQAPKPFNTEEWITRCGAKTPEMRRQYAEELKIQREIWNQEAAARNTDKGDMASLLGLAFVLGWEAYSGGQKATEAQYRWIVKDFRRAFMVDPNYQGMSAADKQYLYEQQMVNVTDAVRLWRQGQKTGNLTDQKAGKESAGRFLQRWWDSPIDQLIATPTGFETRGKQTK